MSGHIHNCCHCECKDKTCPGATGSSMRMKPWGESLKPPQPELAAGKPASIVLEFKKGSGNGWLHSIEFIPVENNGYGDNAYMNVNVYRRYPKGHRLEGQKNLMDVRTSLHVHPKDAEYNRLYPAPLLGDFVKAIDVAAEIVVESVPKQDTKLLRDIAEMEAKLAEMKREATGS